MGKSTPLDIRFWQNVNKTEGCWLWTAGKNASGYGYIYDSGKYVLTHRISYVLNIGPIPDGISVCHSCDTPACVRPDHLFLGTVKDNSDDMWRKGRGFCGEQATKNSHLRKLEENQVLEIRRLAAEGVKTKVIAQKFSINTGHVRLIKRGGVWKYLLDGYKHKPKSERVLSSKNEG